MKKSAMLLAAVFLAALMSSGTASITRGKITPPEESRAQGQPQAPRANPALKSLNVLVGTWDVTRRDFGSDKEMRGQLSFEWMDGGFFLILNTLFENNGARIKAVEYIGYDERSKTCTSRYFDNRGSAASYTWEIRDDTLKVWFGEVGAQAAFRGKFSNNHNTITGRFEWPGGGFTSTMTRIMGK
jgi:uncharacterized protein DUF1579